MHKITKREKRLQAVASKTFKISKTLICAA